MRGARRRGPPLLSLPASSPVVEDPPQEERGRGSFAPLNRSQIHQRQSGTQTPLPAPQANKPAPTASPRPHPPSEQRLHCLSTARPSEPWNPDNREAPSPGTHPTSGTKAHPEQPIASHQSPQSKRGAGGEPSPQQGKECHKAISSIGMSGSPFGRNINHAIV